MKNAPSKYPPSPELNKMLAVREKSQAIGEFLDVFLCEKGVQLGKPHVHNERCAGWDKDRGKYNPGADDRCCFSVGEFETFHYSLEKLLGEFFKINLAKCENERRAILDHLRHAA